jgi:hypothetical protein
MRDFKAGYDINVGGSLHIYDQTSQPKLLVLHTNEELYAEQVHRKAVLSGERKRKFNYSSIILVIGELMISGLALWFYMQGNTDRSELIFNLGSMAVAAISGMAFLQPTSFEQRQKDALQEIDMILHERGAK